jgi:hypothetical protein
MPRPPRSKVASRVAKPTKPPAKAAPARKQQAKPTPVQTKKISEAVNSFSEDSDGLVTKSRSTRSRRKMPWEKTPEVYDEAELTMTGALPTEAEVPVPSIKNHIPAPKARVTRGSAAKKTSPVVPAPVQEDAREEASIVEGDSGYGDLTFSRHAPTLRYQGRRNARSRAIDTGLDEFQAKTPAAESVAHGAADYGRGGQ